MDVAQGILDDLHFLASIKPDHKIQCARRIQMPVGKSTSFWRTLFAAWHDSAENMLNYCKRTLDRAFCFLDQVAESVLNGIGESEMDVKRRKETLGIARLVFDALDQVLRRGLPSLQHTYRDDGNVESQMKSIAAVSSVRLEILRPLMPPPSMAKRSTLINSEDPFTICGENELGIASDGT